MTHEQAVQAGASERYLLEEMSELERHDFENHYFSCLECAEDVRAGGMLREGVRAGFLEAGIDQSAAVGLTPDPRKVVAMRPKPDATNVPRRTKFVWQRSAVLPWAVAATLAVALGYQSLTPTLQLQPQALAPITLRAASRGAEAIVPLRPDTSAVTLALDVNANEPGDLTYELRTADEQTVASGGVQAPPPGAPLLLLVPVWTLRPAEHYILSVRHAPTGNPVGEFRFGVTR